MNETVTEQPSQILTAAQSKANQTLTATAFTELPGSIAGTLAAAIVLILALPVLADLFLAHYRQYKQKTIDRPSGMPGLYRSLMAFGLIAVVSIVIVYLVALVSFYIAIQSPGATALINVLQNLAAILGTALATVVAFYFGIRGAETATDRALAAVGLKPKGEVDQTGPPKIIGRYPTDGQRNVKINSDIVVTFNKAMDGSTITKDTFIVRKDQTAVNIEAEEIKLLVENQAIFNPRDDLEKNTKYIVKVTGEVKDKSGNKMLSDETWSFITMA
ncbi:MAG TPA: Ig-like domain-containing protein [Nitrososphaeraceae archaeon]